MTVADGPPVPGGEPDDSDGASLTDVTHNLGMSIGGNVQITSTGSVSSGSVASSVTGTTSGTGSWIGGSGPLTFTNNFTLAALTASSVTTSFAGATVTFTSFTANGGTVQFTGTVAVAFTTAGQNLNSLSLINNGAKTVTVTGALNVGSKLEVQATQILAMGANNLAVTGTTNAAAGALVGSITSGTGTQVFTGTFQLGSLTASSVTTSFAGATTPYTVTFTSFTANGGTVQFTGTVDVTFTTAGQNLNNLSLINNGAKTVTVTGALNVGGNLEMQATQILAMGAGNLAVTGTTNAVAGALVGTITSTSGTQVFTGNFQLGSLTGSSATTSFAGAAVTFTSFTASLTPNTGTVQFTGTGAQAFTTNGQNLYNLAVQGGPAAVTVSGALNVGAQLSVAALNTLDLAGNNFDITTTLSNLGTIYLNGTQSIHSIGTVDSGHGTFVYYGAAGTVFTSSFNPVGTPYLNNYFNLSIGDATHTATGTFSLDGDVDVAGALTINSGTLDVTAADHLISLDVTTSGSGSWTNVPGDTSGFNPRNGTVNFIGGAGGTITVNGNNTFYNFVTTSHGLTIAFQRTFLQTISNLLQVQGTGPGANTVNLTAENPVPLLFSSWDSDIPVGPPLGNVTPYLGGLWNIDVLPTASLNMQNVNVQYSDASMDPILVGSSVAATVALHDWRWIDNILVLYSYTEDKDGDGKIDRIRITCETSINNDFSGLQVAVTGYTVDHYEAGPYPTDFYVVLKELPTNDTGATPSWHIVTNTSLKDSATQTTLVDPFASDVASDAPVNDTAPPMIAYALAMPGFNQVFVHFSEPVVNAGGGAIGASNFAIPGYTISGFSAITMSGGGTSEAVLTLTGNIAYADLIAGTAITISNIVDMATLPVQHPTIPGFGLPPAPTYVPAWASSPGGTGIPAAPLPGKTTHRISDVLISVPMVNAADTTYFVWPIYAKDQIQLSLTDAQIAALTPAQTAAEGIGLIRAFDGSQWLRADDITVQALLEGALSAYPVSLWFDSNVPSSLQSNGLWLPAFGESGFSGLVPYPDASPSGRGASYSQGTSIGSNLWDFTLPKTDPRIVSISNLGFFFTLQTAPLGATPLYVARLDMTAGTTIPSNWYRLVKPFAFEIHNVRLQAGGVTILNNVIDPTKGQTARLTYQLPSEGSVTVTVFTLDGDVVKHLVLATQDAGNYSVDWDGRNMGGRPVARGIYFIRVVAPGIDEIRKVLVVRN